MSDDGYSTPALDALRPKQRAFVIAYVCGDDTAGNASASYLAAGYKTKVPHVNAAQSLAKPNVAAAVTELRAQTTRKAEQAKILTAADRLEICAEIAWDKESGPRARLAAVKLDAELRGELVQKHENTDKTAPVSTKTKELQAARERMKARGLKVVGQ